MVRSDVKNAGFYQYYLDQLTLVTHGKVRQMQGSISPKLTFVPIRFNGDKTYRFVDGTWRPFFRDKPMSNGQPGSIYTNPVKGAGDGQGNTRD